MRPRNVLYYEARIGLGWTAFLPVLALPALAILLYLADGRPPEPDPKAMVRAFEVTLPLAAALSAANLMSVEREERFGELRATYAEGRWRLPLTRTAGALVLALLSALLGGLCFRMTQGPLPSLLPAVGPTLFLLGLSLLVGNLAGNYWLAAGGMMAYWFFEVLTKGSQTRLFYLFQATWPLDDLDYGLNRWLLAGAGLLLMLINGWVSARRRSTR